MPKGQAKDKGKGPEPGPAAPQFISIDQLAVLLQNISRPMEPKIEAKSGTDRAVALADALAKYQKLGKAIKLHLAEDGVNFPDWEMSLKATVTRVFESAEYLSASGRDDNEDRAALTGVLVGNSVHPLLVSTVCGKTGRVAYATLQARFANVSWTYIMSRWAKASDPSDISSDLNNAYSEMQTCLDEIEKRVGNISKDLVLALLIHQRCHPHFQGIANTLDARIVVNPKVMISLRTILEIAGRMNTSVVPQQSLVFAYWSTSGAAVSGSGSRGGQATGWGSAIVKPKRQAEEDDNMPPSIARKGKCNGGFSQAVAGGGLLSREGDGRLGTSDSVWKIEDIECLVLSEDQRNDTLTGEVYTRKKK
ncbi:hypothetical protein PTTG_27441 [Puccinia triticina 1-1 BBBD Race 1]|uniref:Uncharacterized protein n=1 Tax=Puccinia triticina (isolate 1-1 / race 1 (BBBD)) TaxID=630390 RepID=A0A180GKD3_PUCT1|nr:hypothetical protein PTTG_27441 [Puccinia triticina 1-1 BBBD Race 1]